MKKRSILNLFLIGIIMLSPLSVRAMEVKENQVVYSGNNGDYFNDVVSTNDGGYVAVGYTESTDINGITNKGSADAIIIKYDKNDNVVWQKNYGGTVYDRFERVTLTTDSGYVAVGYTQSTDIEVITGAIIVKYDKDGNIKWQKNYSGSIYDRFADIASTNDGGYVAVGSTTSTDIEGVTNNGGGDAIIVKYDKNGNIEWQKNYGGTVYDWFDGVTLTTDGGYVAVGESASTDIEGITNKGYTDAIIVKYDKNGNIEWQKSYGGNGFDNFYKVTTTTDGGYVAVGYLGSTDIQDITNKGEYDAVIVKYDKDGNIKWQKNYGGSGNDYFEGVTLTSDGGYIAVGSSFKFGEHLDDAFVIRISYQYDIVNKSDGNGTVTSSTVVGSQGDLVEFTVTPKNGYQLKKVVVTTSSGEVLEFTDYKFTMPSSDVEIYAEFEPITNPSTGLSNPYFVCGLIAIFGVVSYIILKKKKYI